MGSGGGAHQHGSGHAHGLGHSHGFGRSPGSGEGPAAEGSAAGRRRHRRVLTAALVVTVLNLVAQVVGAWWSRSLALLADAGHQLTDVMGLGLALTAVILAGRSAGSRRTWGFQRAEVLAAALQAVALTGVALYVLVEGIRRLIDPPEVSGGAMLVFGVLGLVGNAVAIGLLARDRDANLNLRAAFLEVVNDALGSTAVIVAAVVIATTGWTRADAVVSLLVGALILPRALRILTESGAVLLESTPKGLDLDDVRRHLLEARHVHDVHDLHASSIATGLPVLSAHVVVDESCFVDGDLPQLLDHLQQCVAEHFAVSVEHSTFQFEPVTHAGHERAAHH